MIEIICPACGHKADILDVDCMGACVDYCFCSQCDAEISLDDGSKHEPCPECLERMSVPTSLFQADLAKRGGGVVFYAAGFEPPGEMVSSVKLKNGMRVTGVIPNMPEY